MAENEAAPKTSEAVVIGLYPDFCRKDGRVVAYDLVAFGSADQANSNNVRMTGCWASHEGARLERVVNNAPATAGIRSGVVEGFARPAGNLARNVRINGQPCVRHDTEFLMNCSGPDGPANTRGKMIYVRGGPAAYEVAGAQVGGFVKGVAVELWSTAAGILQLGAGAVQRGMDGQFGAFFDRLTGGKYPLLPSFARAVQTDMRVAETVQAIWNRPGIVWDAVTQDVVALWGQGQYGEAIGKGGTRILTTLVGTKGVTQAGKLKFLKSLAPAQRARLVQKGVITAEEAVAAVTAREAGVIITKPALRLQYEAKVKALADRVPGLRASGKSSEDIARTLHAERRALGVQYKDLTPPDLLEQYYAANLRDYGDKLGPTIDFLRAKGKSWDDIILSASRPGGRGLPGTR